MSLRFSFDQHKGGFTAMSQQMFDWIFFAIVVPPALAAAWQLVSTR